jgi:Subtilase family
MPERPLLFFPRPARVSVQERRPNLEEIIFPSSLRQLSRLTPKFTDLERVFEAKLLRLQNNPDGVVPEQVLVLETVGRIDDFYRAVRRIRGLEWMGEFDLEDIAPDEDFYLEEDREAGLPGRVYLILHNQEGLAQLQSLWETFQRSPEHPQFSKGRTKFRDLFNQLRDLHPWGPEDRLRETGLLEGWQERVEAGQEVMRVEIELWAQNRSWARTRVENWVSNLIGQEGGRVLGRCDAAETIAYHALLTELPIQAVQRILQDPTVELARCEQVMFFRPPGQVLFTVPEGEPESVPAPAQGLERPAGEPIAALLDGLPLENHEWLTGRLIVDDPDGWGDQYPANTRQHGTAMASLILHAELDAPATALSRPLYVRPVLKPDPQNRNWETIPPNSLTVDLIHRAVLRMLERDGDNPPAAPWVRIINLSLGDRARPFDRYPSPWARLLDYLAVKYNVLFIVSAGNHPNRIELSLPRSEAGALLVDSERLQREVLRTVRDENRLRRLLSPAEAINALTVGALNADFSPLSPLPPGGFDPLAGIAFPSLYSAQGLGFRRAVKPDIFFPGGRLLYREAYRTDRVVLEPIEGARPPGQRVATPGNSPGDISASRYMQGTSNAAALVTRLACQINEVLEELRLGPEERVPQDEDLAVLIRTLLVHGSSWGDSVATLADYLGLRRGDEELVRICGFGSPEAARILACTEQRVTLLGWGAIQEGQAFGYDLLLPPSLSGIRTFRRLTTTVSWFSPIHPRHHRYRRAHVWLTRYSGRRREEDALSRLGLHRVGTEHNLARRGTVQHEIYEGEGATTYGEDETLTFQVNCRSDAGQLERPIRYGLAITLEVEERTGLPIYDEIRTRIRPRIAPPITP